METTNSMPSTHIAGFLSNSNTPEIGTTYDPNNAVIMISGTAAEDPLAQRPPKNITEFGRLIIELTNAAGVTQVDCWLSWDANGDRLAAGPFSTTTIVDALTAGGAKSVAFGLDRWTPVTPTGASWPTFYLHIKVTGATPDVSYAYLLWRQISERL